MGHSSRSLEDRSAEGNVDCRGLAQVDSEENNISLARDYSCAMWDKKKKKTSCLLPLSEELA